MKPYKSKEDLIAFIQATTSANEKLNVRESFRAGIETAVNELIELGLIKTE